MAGSVVDGLGVEAMAVLVVRERCDKRVTAAWPGFTERRLARLAQQDRYGRAAEKVAENILEDLFTHVLDWPLSAVNFQVGYADLLLTSLGVKYLIMEVKRPGALVWRRPAVDAALTQARRYAAEQKVRCVGVSDGELLYAANVSHGGLTGRVLARLTEAEPPLSLWWLSVHGIYRPPDCRPELLPDLPASGAGVQPAGGTGALLHPKYHLPAECFAYAASPVEPRTWKLPYRHPDGSIDHARLPKAIQAILSSYRGLKVGSVPETAIPDVLARLAEAACELGRMPHQCAEPAPIYPQLAAALDQFGRLTDITAAHPF